MCNLWMKESFQEFLLVYIYFKFLFFLIVWQRRSIEGSNQWIKWRSDWTQFHYCEGVCSDSLFSLSLSLSLSLPRSSEIDGGCYKGAAITAWALVYAVLILPSMAPHKCKVKHFHFPLCCGGNIAICISHVHTPSKILLPFPNRIIFLKK